MAQNINITVNNRIAIADANALLVCNNEDIIVTFAFDAEWSAIDQKILRVKYENTFREVIFTGNSCIVPAPDNVDYAEIGVYGGGIVTTRAYVPCLKSTVCPKEKGKIPHTAYQQLLGYYKEIIERTENVVEATDAANEAASAANTAKETTNTATARALEAASSYEDSAPVIEVTASGEYVAVHDSAERPVRGLTLYGKSTQDGTPTTSSPIDIVNAAASGEANIYVAGKNLACLSVRYDVDVYGMSITAEANSSEVLIHGASLQMFSHAVMRSVKLSPGTYVLSCQGINIHDSVNDRLFVVDISRDVVLANYCNDENPITFTIRQPTVVRVDMVFAAGSVYNNRTIKIQIERGTVATEYESYKQAQLVTLSLPNGLPGIPVSSGGNYTDANGQEWICDEVDLARGVHVQRVAVKTFDGTETSWRQYEGKYLFMVDWSGVDGGWEKGYAMCTHFEYDTRAYNEGIGAFAIDQKGLAYFSSTAADVNTFKTWLHYNTPTVYCKLATPVETPLSDEEIAAFLALKTKFPSTTVLNDAGANMEMKYAADTKNYIDNKINAVLNA